MSRVAHFVEGASMHNPELARGAAQFASAVGQQRPDMLHFASAFAHPLMTNAMSQAYGALPHHDPEAEQAFGAMRDETNRQFDFLTRPRRQGGMGVDVSVQKTDPYAGPADLMQDLAQRRHMSVMATSATGEHPFFTDEENDRFRAVHDAFGHAATGRGFDRHGEEAAFQSHASMYTPLARQALASETRGQNSALITSGGFQPQKVALLPARFAQPGVRPPIGQRSQAAAAGAMLQARQFHASAFGRDLPVAMP